MPVGPGSNVCYIPSSWGSNKHYCNNCNGNVVYQQASVQTSLAAVKLRQQLDYIHTSTIRPID